MDNFKITFIATFLLLGLSQAAWAETAASPTTAVANQPPPPLTSVPSPANIAQAAGALLSGSSDQLPAPVPVVQEVPVPVTVRGNSTEVPLSAPPTNAVTSGPSVPPQTTLPPPVSSQSSVVATPTQTAVPTTGANTVSNTSQLPTAPPPGVPVSPPSAPATTVSGGAGTMPVSAPVPVAASVPISGPPAAVSAAPAELRSDVAQFQNWLQTNNQNSQKVVEAKPLPPASKGHIPLPQSTCKPRRPVPIVVQRNGPLVSSPFVSYKRSQEIMLKSAPATPRPNPDSTAAFNSMLAQHMPLTPRQVVELRQLIDKSQRAASIPANIPPKPVSSTLMINLSPGATPPAIRLAQGYVSSLVFVDSSGAPWPIAGFEVGDPKTTTIQWDGKSNIVFMQAVSPYSEGNFVVRLVGLLTPITLEIVSGQRVVDYRTDIHVPGLGPNSKDISTGTTLPLSANQVLLSVLDGVAPPGSRELSVKGGEGQVWLVGDTMYLRTRFTLLSPGWIGKMTSPDGMFAYELQRTSSILVSQYGNPVEFKIEGY